MARPRGAMGAKSICTFPMQKYRVHSQFSRGISPIVVCNLLLPSHSRASPPGYVSTSTVRSSKINIITPSESPLTALASAQGAIEVGKPPLFFIIAGHSFSTYQILFLLEAVGVSISFGLVRALSMASCVACSLNIGVFPPRFNFGLHQPRNVAEIETGSDDVTRRWQNRHIIHAP